MSAPIKRPNLNSLELTRKLSEHYEHVTQSELDHALERSAQARGLERDVLWWKGAGL